MHKYLKSITLAPKLNTGAELEFSVKFPFRILNNTNYI